MKEVSFEQARYKPKVTAVGAPTSNRHSESAGRDGAINNERNAPGTRIIAGISNGKKR
jgi:hypothetical protein